MKKFLVFCLIAVVTATLGLMTYRFLTLEETITVNQTEFLINVGEEVPLELIRKNQKASTVITYETLNADIVEYNGTLKKFISNGVGGKATLRITSSIKGFTPILISVTVGDGSEFSPYFVKDATELAQIGVKTPVNPTTETETTRVIKRSEEPSTDYIVKRKLTDSYTLVTDIDMSTYNNGEWQPLGSVEEPFEGTFNFNGHSITNMNMTSGDYDSAGLFAKVSEKALFKGGISFSNCKIEGNYDACGLLAGYLDGTVNRVNITNSSVISTKENAMVGLVSGKQTGDIERATISNSVVSATGEGSIAGGFAGVLESSISKRATIERSYVSGVDVSATYRAGGIAGQVNGGIVVNCYSESVVIDDVVKGNVKITGSNTLAAVGGLAGEVSYFGESINAMVVDCYTTCKVSAETVYKGQAIGYCVDQNRTEKVVNLICGIYYESSVGLFGVGNVKGVGEIKAIETLNEVCPYVYNTLETEINFLSHKTYNGAVETSIYWAINNNYSVNVWSKQEGKNPVLDIEGAYFDNEQILGTITEKEDIKSIADFTKIRDDLSGNYILRADIDLSEVTDWEPIGTQANPFTGTFTCETIDGQPKYKISNLTITLASKSDVTSDELDAVKGLFGYTSPKAKISNIVLEDVKIQRGAVVGGIVAYNRGVIQNCSVIGKDALISTNCIGQNVGDTTNFVVYVGGIAGINDGTITDSKVIKASVSALNAIDKTVTYIGGIVGSNTNVVQKCYVTDKLNSEDTQSFTPSVNYSKDLGEVYIAGVVGYNQKDIADCNFNGNIVASTINGKVRAAGVVGKNDTSGSVARCYATGEIFGYAVGGIVSENRGSVSESYVTSVLTGVDAGGIVYYMANGMINDCYTLSTICGTGSGNLCGFVVSIDLVSESSKSASLRNCFASTTIQGSGTFYYESASSIREDEYWSLFVKHPRKAGYLINCIFNKEASTNTNRSNINKGIGSSYEEKSNRNADNYISDYNEENSYLWDCALTEAECRTRFDVFRTYGFSDSIWDFANGDFPTLKNCK